MKQLILSSLFSLLLVQTSVASELDLGPLKHFIGKWQSTKLGGIDMAPGQIGSPIGKGAPAVEPYYETLTFEAAADATNASNQYLAAVSYKQEVFRKKDNVKFHDQRGYLIYDAKNQLVYNSFCIPRATCVVTQGKAGTKMTLKSSERGIAESSYMSQNATTLNFTMEIEVKGNTLTYSQVTNLEIYGKPFAHTDTASLERIYSTSHK